MNLFTTLAGSMMEGVFPAGWDLRRIDACCAHLPEKVGERQPFWHRDFRVTSCATIGDFEVMLGHEIAQRIARARTAGKELAIIFPVGPMGMYRWVVRFLTEWGVDCPHVHGFNMDEWSDREGNTVPASDPGSFQKAMEQAFYGPLGKGTVPPGQRHYTTKDALPRFADQIGEIRDKGGELVVVYGIGRVFHIAFWEPHFAQEFASEDEWRKPTYRLAARLHPFTIEQNALTSFKSRTTQVPAFANTIGPGLFLNADYAIGGCDGAFGRGMMWQGMSLWTTLRHGPDIWIPSSFMPTRPGRLFFLQELAGPLIAECN